MKSNIKLYHCTTSNPNTISQRRKIRKMWVKYYSEVNYNYYEYRVDISETLWKFPSSFYTLYTNNIEILYTQHHSLLEFYCKWSLFEIDVKFFCLLKTHIEKKFKFVFFLIEYISNMAAATSVIVLDRSNNTTCTINLHGTLNWN